MIKLDLRRIFQEKGIENPHLFLKKCGVPSHTSHRLLYNEIDSIRFKHLEKICLHLNCTVDDLCSWIPDDKNGDYKAHPLNKLRRIKIKENISHKIKGLTLDKLDQVRNFIDELEKGQ